MTIGVAASREWSRDCGLSQLYKAVRAVDHCPDSARTQGANGRVVLCLMNELVADHERVL